MNVIGNAGLGHTAKAASMASGGASLSVIVPTRNVEGTIEACLTSLLSESDGASLEVIVVDNGSVDRTLELARQFPITLLKVPPAFVSTSRNAGASAARHPVLAFVDSDCVVLSGWADAIRAAMSDQSVGAAGCRHLLRGEPTWVEEAWYHRDRRQPLAGSRDVTYLPAGNLAVRRTTFQAVHGFDDTLETGEDPDLCIRIASIGFRVIEDSRIRCVHLGEPRSLLEVFRRERWHGRGLRIRYSDGRVAPIALSTFGFLLTLLVPVLAALLSTTAKISLPPVVYSAPLLVPVAYASRYLQGHSPLRFFRLIAIYTAYFLGRVTALPVVSGRLLKRRSPSATP